MRKRLFSFLLFVVAGLSAVHAYDFSVVVPSGQTLYFDTISSTKVRVTYPNDTNKFDGGYLGYAMPTGNLEIPSSITYGGKYLFGHFYSKWHFL